MKSLLALVLLLNTTLATAEMTISEPKEPVHVCHLKEEKISCALIVAMYHKVKQKHYLQTKGI